MLTSIKTPVDPVYGDYNACKSLQQCSQCKSCILDSSGYFKQLSKEAKEALKSLLDLKTINKKEIIYTENCECKYLYILISGEVKIFKTMANGKQQIHKLAHIPGDLIACEDLFLDRHGSTAESINDVCLGYIKRKDLHKCATKYNEISETLMLTMSRNLNSYIRHIANLSQKSALERVCSYLVFLYNTHIEQDFNHDFITDSLSRIELADMLGITQRTLIRSLNTLKQHNYISINRQGFLIPDIDILEKISSGHH